MAKQQARQIAVSVGAMRGRDWPGGPRNRYLRGRNGSRGVNSCSQRQLEQDDPSLPRLLVSMRDREPPRYCASRHSAAAVDAAQAHDSPRIIATPAAHCFRPLRACLIRVLKHQSDAAEVIRPGQEYTSTTLTELRYVLSRDLEAMHAQITAASSSHLQTRPDDQTQTGRTI